MNAPRWTDLAAAVLAEVGLTFDDVYDLGSPWKRDPLSFAMSRPQHRGLVHSPSLYNPTSRKRYLIGLTGPVDSELMLAILAHECGHIVWNAWTSVPTYIHEARAEQYAHDAIRRHLGREPHPYIVSQGKKYVRKHCWTRYEAMGPAPHKRWDREVVEWCGFAPPESLEFAR